MRQDRQSHRVIYFEYLTDLTPHFMFIIFIVKIYNDHFRHNWNEIDNLVAIEPARYYNRNIWKNRPGGLEGG